MVAAHPHLPILRNGEVYRSLDISVIGQRGSTPPIAEVSMANAGLISRDCSTARLGGALQQLTHRELLEICAAAAQIFLHGELPCGAEADVWTYEQYLDSLALSTGIPIVHCRRSGEKIVHVLTNLETILSGHCRTDDLTILDGAISRSSAIASRFTLSATRLGVILPNNSPGVNALWLPAVPMKVPLVLKPGRNDPFTPWRLIQALLAAGYPKRCLSFYPAEHDGSNAVVESCSHAILFGDDSTVRRYRNDRFIQVHGPGHSKIILGDDQVDDWPRYIDLMLASVLDNGGRSCINCSTIHVARYGMQVAEALADKLVHVRPKALDDDDAKLAIFGDKTQAAATDAEIYDALVSGGAVDVTAGRRTGSRIIEADDRAYLLPTVIFTDSIDHPLANREYMFPYICVVESNTDDLFDLMGESLSVTLLTSDLELQRRATACRKISRLNLGAIPTTSIDWRQPHEGNLFEFLYRHVAVQEETQQGHADGSTLSAKMASRSAGVESPGKEFDFSPLHTRLIGGAGSLRRVAECTTALGCRSILVVTDAGVVRAGHWDRLMETLKTVDCKVTTFDSVRENPTTADVDRCLAVAKSNKIDGIIALGGGSPIDTAKGVNFVYSNGGVIGDYWGTGKATKPMIPLIAIPTTAGTGSECQSYALIADDRTGHKMACGDKKAAPCVAILDPELTVTMPSYVTACTGIDALAHAIESYVTTRRNVFSTLYATEAFKRISSGLPAVIDAPDDLAARYEMLIGAAYAGLAIEASMLGAAHSAANPLTARYKITHGHAVGVMLSAVIRFNASYTGTMQCYGELARAAGIVDPRADVETAYQAFFDGYSNILRLSGLETDLRKLGADAADLEQLAEEAESEWTAQFNPRRLGKGDFMGIYREVFGD